MKPSEMAVDCVILGGGVIGLSTALHLAELGLSTVVLERHHVGAGQSGRAAGIVRSLVAHRSVARWLEESKRFWQTFSERFCEPLPVHRDGYMLIGSDPIQSQMAAAVQCARGAGCTVEILEPLAAEILQPGLRSDLSTPILYEPDAVHVDPMCATQALARAVQRAGGTVVQGCRGLDLIRSGNRITGVITDSGTYSAAHVLIATSTWGAPQLARLGVDIPIFPHRAEMVFFEAPPTANWRLQRIISDARTMLYLRPEGDHQLFVGWREGDRIKSISDTVPEDPDHYDRNTCYDTVADLQKRLSELLPVMANGFVHRTYACVYDYTADAMPILDRAPELDGLYFALGFSGGGFSLSPYVGRVMAKFIATGKKTDQLEMLRFTRFQEGASISWSNAASTLVSD